MVPESGGGDLAEQVDELISGQRKYLDTEAEDYSQVPIHVSNLYALQDRESNEIDL